MLFFKIRALLLVEKVLTNIKKGTRMIVKLIHFLLRSETESKTIKILIDFYVGTLIIIYNLFIFVV